MNRAIPATKLLLLMLFLVLPYEGGSLSARIEEIANDYRGWFGVVVFCALWVLSTVSVIVTAYLPSTVVRLLLALVVVPSTLLSTVYWSISQKTLMYANVETWWVERALAGSAVDAYAEHFPDALLIVAVGLLAIMLPPRLNLGGLTSKVNGKWMTPVAYSAAVMVLPVFGSVNVIQNDEGLGGLPVHDTGVTFSSVMLYNKLYVEKDRLGFEIDIPLTEKRGNKPNILFVVHESIRGDYVDININKGVTPYLYSQSDKISNFGYASSMANCSSMTHQALRVGMNMHRAAESQRRNPFIWAYAKQAGYRIHYIDAQVAVSKANNSIGGYERDLIEHFYKLNDPDQDDEVWSRDLRVQGLIEKILKQSESQSEPVFIYAVLNDAHFPYQYNYFRNEVHYPIAGEGLSRARTIVNDYKNAVRWSVDAYFKKLLNGNTSFDNTILLFTFDHGQDLVRKTHCTVFEPDLHEGLVPLFAMTEYPKWKARFAEAARLNKNKASHFNLTPTILQIFGYQLEGINKRHGLSLFQEINDPRKFLSRGIRINYAGVGLSKKIIWNQLPDDWVAQ